MGSFVEGCLLSDGFARLRPDPGAEMLQAPTPCRRNCGWPREFVLPRAPHGRHRPIPFMLHSRSIYCWVGVPVPTSLPELRKQFLKPRRRPWKPPRIIISIHQGHLGQGHHCLGTLSHESGHPCLSPCLGNPPCRSCWPFGGE